MADTHEDEAAFRAIAHLSYYAVYHLIARHFGLDPADRLEASHADLRARLRGANPPSVVPRHVFAAKRVYSSLLHGRVLADYHLDAPFTGDLADQSLAQAQGVFAALRGGA
ncbi:MAG TPA: hypothetical protein VED21_36110 [Azospirillum sp.]|nr:hypothetical protein [Azospirillum sp.]